MGSSASISAADSSPGTKRTGTVCPTSMRVALDPKDDLNVKRFPVD